MIVVNGNLTSRGGVNINAYGFLGGSLVGLEGDLEALEA